MKINLKLTTLCIIAILLHTTNAHSAKSEILVDASTGKICYEKNIDQRLLPASTAKLVTALVVRDIAILSDKFFVSKKASLMEPTKVGLVYKSEYFVSHLLHALLMRSANDAAVVLAEGVAASEENFVYLMNKKCEQLGLKNTKFANASGLPSQQEQYSTVYDLVVVMNEVIKDPVLVHILKKKVKVIKGSKSRKIRVVNRNKLLGSEHGVVLGKTGYTRAAGHCFVGYCKERGVLFAMLGGARLWSEVIDVIELGHYPS